MYARRRLGTAVAAALCALPTVRAADECPPLTALFDGLGLSGINLTFSIAGAIPVHTYDDVITDLSVGHIGVSSDTLGLRAVDFGVELRDVGAIFDSKYTCESCGFAPGPDTMRVAIPNKTVQGTFSFVMEISDLSRTLRDYPPDTMSIHSRGVCLDPTDEMKCKQTDECTEPDPLYPNAKPGDHPPMCVMKDQCWMTLGHTEPEVKGFLAFLLDKSATPPGGDQLNNILYAFCDYRKPPPGQVDATFVQILGPHVKNASDWLLRHYHPIDIATPTKDGEADLEERMKYTPTGPDGIVNFADNWIAKAGVQVLGLYGQIDPQTNLTALSSVIKRPGLFAGADTSPLWEHDLPWSANFSADRWPSLAAFYTSSVINITVHNVTVVGAENITELSASILADHSLSLHTRLQQIAIDAWVSVGLGQPEVGMPANYTVAGFNISIFNDGSSGKPPFQTSDLLRVRFSLTDASLDLAALLAIDSDMLKQFDAGSLWVEDRTLHESLICLLHPVKMLNLTALGVGVDNVDWGSLDGLLCPEITTVANEAVKAGLAMYLGSLRHAGPAALSEGVLPYVREHFWDPVNEKTNKTGPPPPECKLRTPKPGPEYINMQSNNLVRLARWGVNQFMGVRPPPPPPPTPVPATPKPTPGPATPKPTPKPAAPPPASDSPTPAAGPDLNDVLRTLEEAGLTYLQDVYAFGLYTSYGNLQLKVTDLALVGGLATFQEMSALEPCGAYCTDTSLKMTGPLAIDVTLQLVYDGHDAGSKRVGPDQNDLFRVRLNISRISLSARAVTLIDENVVRSISIGNFLKPSCLLSVFALEGGLQVSDLNLAVGESRITGVDTHLYKYEGRPYPSCTSTDIDLLASTLTAPENQAAVNQVTQNVIKWFLDHDQFLTRQDLISQLTTLVGICPDGPQGEEMSTRIVAPADIHYPLGEDKGSWWKQNWPVVVFIGVPVVGTFIALVILSAVRLRKASRRQAELKDEYDTGGIRWSETMFNANQDVVSRYLKAMVPFLLAFACATFIVAHVKTGAAVNIEVRVIGDNFKIENFFAYSLSNSIRDMWSAEVYFLALLIAIASGAWPYIKILLLTWCWFMPPEVVSHKRRGFFFSALDYAGKWSLIDLFMLILMTAAFALHIENPQTELYSFLPPKTVVINERVIPDTGIYAFLCASILLLGTNHLMIIVHRNVGKRLEEDGKYDPDEFRTYPVLRDLETTSFFGRLSGGGVGTTIDSRGSINHDEPNEGQRLVTNDSITSARSGVQKSIAARTDGAKSRNWYSDGRVHNTKESLAFHNFTCDGSAQKSVVVKRWGLTLLLFISAVMLVVGVSIRTFSFEFKGAARIALEWTEEGSSVEHYSVWSLASKMNEQGEEYDAFSSTRAGYITLTFFYLLFVFFIPLLQLAFLAVLWIVPMTLPTQKKLFTVNEILAAWSSMEVFVLAIIASLLEISQFAQTIIGDMCQWINKVMGVLSTFDLLGGNDAKCFDVHAKLESGVWLLFVAAVLMNVTYNILTRVCETAIQDREHQSGAEDMLSQSGRGGAGSRPVSPPVADRAAPPPQHPYSPRP